MSMWRRVTLPAGAALLGLAASQILSSADRPGRPAPGPDGVRFDAVRVSTGVSLSYAESGPVDGEPVILLHGYSDSWFSFSRLLPLLPPNVHAYAPDQRGHGDSERPASSYAPRDLAADAIAFMDAMAIERATVVGHSMGGFVAQHVAALAPERVARLVVIGSTTTPRNVVGIDELRREVEPLTDPVPEEFIRAFQESTVHVPVPAEFMERVVAESRKLPAHVWRGVMAGLLATDPPTGLAEHRIPTLIVWGDRDAYMSRPEQDALVAQHGTALLRVYRDTGHAPQWERPEEVTRDLEAFLRVEPAPAG